MEVMKIGFEGMKKGGLEGLPYLQYTTFLSLSDEESVIVSPVIAVHTLRKKGEIKKVSILTRLPSSLVP